MVKKYTTKEELIFHNDSADKIYDFVKNEPILVGHNSRGYDQYILKAILSGFSVEEVKKVNDYIIGGGQGFELQYDFKEPLYIWDTIQDVVPPKSLKEIEANLLLDITETTIPFDMSRKWNKKEYEEVLYYCEHDVDALFPLFEARKGYFETKFDLCMLANVEPKNGIGLTNAKLCAKFLEAERVDRNDERDFKLPSTIDMKYIDPRIKDFFWKIHDPNITDKEFFSSKLEYDEHGMPAVISLGGKHGALPNFIFEQEKEPDMMVINADFESLYPHILALEEYNTISRNIKDKNKYYDTLKLRLQLKHEGKKKEQQALKLVLNTTYGAQLNEYNDLYDARGARRTCIYGQLLISELTERIYEIGNISLIQVNTDGLMVKLPKSKLDEYYKVCDEFSKKVKINLEYDVIDKIIQRDVNNYILYMKDKGHYKIKAKGGIFSNMPELSMNDNLEITSEYIPNFKTNSMSIVSEAIARNLLIGTPVEDTINNCDNPFRFQMVTHLGGTYDKCILEHKDGTQIELQRNNRVYAGVEKTGDKIYKVKGERKDSLANCPPNPIVDNDNHVSIDMINKTWYIKKAKQSIADFVGKKEIYMDDKLEKLKKDELIAIIKDNANMKGEDSTSPINSNGFNQLMQKINLFRKTVRERNFILDKELPRNLGGGEIYSIDQVYQAIQDIAIRTGLDFSFEVIDLIRFDIGAFKPATGAPQNIATIKCRILLTDIETGCSKEYIIISQGSDSIDKAVNSASSYALRNWFNKTFTPSIINGEKITFGDGNTFSFDNDLSEEVKSQPTTPKYVSQETKAEIVNEITSTPKDASTNDFDEVTDLIYELRELTGNLDAGKKTMDAMINGNITDIELMNAKLKLQNAIADIKRGN